MKIPTQRQLKMLFHESNLIEGYDDPAFDAQQMVAWEYLIDVHFDLLHHHDITKIQRILTLRQTDLQPAERGAYRKIPVWVGGTSLLAYGLIKHHMANWLLDYQEMDPVAAHIQFEKIHPFVDGNGRTGRLLLWWTQMHQNHPLTRITYAERQTYYRWFK